MDYFHEARMCALVPHLACETDAFAAFDTRSSFSSTSCRAAALAACCGASSVASPSVRRS